MLEGDPLVFVLVVDGLGDLHNRGPEFAAGDDLPSIESAERPQ